MPKRRSIFRADESKPWRHPASPTGIGRPPGASDAAIFAAEILALSDPEIARKLVQHKESLVKSVEEKNARLQQLLAEKKSK